jgi:uncharacterized RDD family membrane protein YckC
MLAIKNYCGACGLPTTLEGACPDNQCQSSLVVFSQQSLTPYKKAQLYRRALAVVIDFAPIFILNLLGLILSPFTLGISAIVTGLFSMFYLTTKDLRAGRYSPGKRVFALTIKDKYGHPASNKQAITRNLPYLFAWLITVFPAIGLFGYVLVFFLGLADCFLVLMDDEGKRLGDRLAATQVVEE